MFARFSRFFQQLPFATNLLLICISIYCVAILLFMLAIYNQWNNSIEQQADAIGQTIISQTANEAVIALAAEDTLGLNILLRELLNNPYINYSVLYSPDNQIIADAGKAQSDNQHRIYSQQLSFQRVLAGNLQIQLNIRQLQQPMYKSLQSSLLIALVILLLASLALYFSVLQLRKKLTALNDWLLKPTAAVPHQKQQDEIGQLARNLHQLLAPPLLHEVIEETPPEAAAQDQPEQEQPQQDLEQTLPEESILPKHAVALVVQLNFEQSFGNLEHSRQQQLFEQYQTAVRNCAKLYQADLQELPQQRNVLIFDDLNQHYVRYAICAGELLRAFAHQLQIAVADSCCTVSMQLGLSHGQLQDGNQQLISQATELSSYSRNLVLLCAELAKDQRALACARLRSIARPENTNCVEQLLVPYLSQLDSQLELLLN